MSVAAVIMYRLRNIRRAEHLEDQILPDNFCRVEQVEEVIKFHTFVFFSLG